MILPDANLLLYAEDSLSKHHEAARTWWDSVLSGTTPVFLCWPVVNAFIRIATNPRIFERPLTMEKAIARVESWLRQPCVRLVGPTENHWQVFQSELLQTGATGNLVPDAHLSALAIEYDCTLYSSDNDFARFPSLSWVNPVAGK